MSAPVDVLAVLDRTVAELGEHRQTHVVWRDWLRQDPENVKVNPHAGSAEFHEGVIDDYDRHLTNLRAAHAAVKELIEAARGCLEHGRQGVVTPGAAAARVERLRAALARVGGAS